MSSNKDKETKKDLKKANKESRRAPVWAFAATNRKVRYSPKSGRSWRRDKIY
jgi:large subunit ribosomal protein L39e